MVERTQLKAKRREGEYLDPKHVLAGVPAEEGRLALLPSQHVVGQSHFTARDVGAQVLEGGKEREKKTRAIHQAAEKRFQVLLQPRPPPK